jgi:hypothetical protein
MTSEALDFTGIESDAEKGILVGGTDAALVGTGGPADPSGMGFGGIDQRTGGEENVHSAVGRRVANSKSMMQKRPACWL